MWHVRKWHILSIFIILLIGVWGVVGLWKLPGLPTSHDSISHMARMYAYEEGLKDGIFPVLWARRMFWGIGSPVLMLNYQVPYYFAMIWRSIGLNLDDSFKAVLSFSQIASGLLMYFALKSRYKTLPSLLGAVLYMVTPYRFLNIYVRGAMGEVFSTMFPPLILSGIWRGSLPLQTLGWAGMFLSHPVGSALYSGVFLGYALVNAQFKNVLQVLKKFFIPYTLAFMIGAFNLLPTLALTKYTYYKTSDSDTLHQFPTFRQLAYDNWGYGFSMDNDQDEMSFQIGVIQWLLLGMGIMTALSAKKSPSQSEVRYLILVFTLAILLMLQATATPIYVYLGMSKIIDYPWRILMIFALLSAMLAPQLLAMVKNKTMRNTLFLLLIFGAIYTNRNHIRINLIWPWPSDIFSRNTGDAFGEYAAKYRASREGSQFDEISEFIEGSGNIEVTKDRSNETSVRIKTDAPAIVRFNGMYFPGWRARIDGVSTPIDERQDVNSPRSPCYVTVRQAKHIDDSGLVACHIPAGESKLSLKYESLPVQKMGNLITLAGIGIYLWILFRSSSPHIMRPMR